MRAAEASHHTVEEVQVINDSQERKINNAVVTLDKSIPQIFINLVSNAILQDHNQHPLQLARNGLVCTHELIE